VVFAFTKDFQLVKCWHLQLGLWCMPCTNVLRFGP